MEAALDVHETYANKRLIVHFVQPHEPYIGENAMEQFGQPYGMERPRKLAEGEYGDLSEIDGDDYPTVMRLFRQGELNRSDVWDAYKENLEIAIPHIQIADHGEMFGKRLWLPYPQVHWPHGQEPIY